MSNRAVLFKGYSDIDQIHTIFRLLGTPCEASWPGLTQVPYWRGTYPDWPARPLQSFLPRLGAEGVDLVAQIFRYDPRSRLTARAALLHPFIRPFSRSSSRAPSRVTPTAATSTNSAAVQAQSSGVVAVPAFMESRVAPMSRCASAMELTAPLPTEPVKHSEMQSMAVASAITSRVVFQPIRGGAREEDSQAGSGAAATSAAVAPVHAAQQQASSAGSSAPLALPLASRAQRTDSNASTKSGDNATAAAPSAPAPAPTAGMVASSSSNYLHQDLVMENDAAEDNQQPVVVEVAATKAIAPGVAVKVAVPVRTVAPRKQTVPAVAPQSTQPAAAPARRSSGRNKASSNAAQASQPTTELFEPPTKALRKSAPQVAQVTAEDAAELFANRARNDSDTSGMSFLSSALEFELGCSSIDEGDNEDDGMVLAEELPDIVPAPVCAAKVPAPTAAAPVPETAAPAQQAPKGRAGKRKFGGLSPSLELMAPITKSGATAAIGYLAGSAQRSASTGGPTISQAPRVTPEALLHTSNSPVYWAPTPDTAGAASVLRGGVAVVGGSGGGTAQQEKKAAAPRCKSAKLPVRSASASDANAATDKATAGAGKEPQPVPVPVVTATAAVAGSARRSQRGRA